MRHKSNSGFTLVELLVALSIFSVLIVTIYSSFMSGMSAKEKGETIVTLAGTAHEITRRLSVDLANCLAFSAAGFSGEPGQITFVTLQAPADMTAPRVCRVTYYTHTEDDTVLGSLQRDCQILGSDYREGDLSGACTRQLEFTYAYRDPEVQRIEWSDFWLGTEQSPLPLAVRVRLVLESGDETLRIDKVIRVPVAFGLEDDVASSI